MDRAQVDNPLSRTWTNRAMWGAFLEAHAERRVAATPTPSPETNTAVKAGAVARQGRTPAPRRRR